MDVWALTEFGKELKKIQQPIPEPKGSEILIRTTHSGVCHSDIHYGDGEYDLGGGKTMYVKDRPGVKLPIAMGHEILGDVVAVGPDVTSVPIGARRIVYPWIGCMNCKRCANGEDNMCNAQRSLGIARNGGHSEYVLVDHPRYLADPGDVDPVVACTFGCSGITTLNAVSKLLPLDPDETVVLIGAGGVGLAAISVLRAYNHKKIVSVDVADDKLAAATKAGASAVVNSATSADPVKDITAAAGGPVVNVIDFVSNTKTATMINSMLGKGAKWVQVGVMGGTTELSNVVNIFKAITLYGNITGDPSHLQEVTRLAREGKLPAVPTSTMPWDQVNEAMQLLKDGKVTGRLILVK